MARIFISYNRNDIQFIGELVPLLEKAYGHGCAFYDDQIPGGTKWWEIILREIAACDLFIYLCSNDSLKSSYCQGEFREAIRLQKQILPVIVRPRTVYPVPGVDFGAELPDDIATTLRDTNYVDAERGFRDRETSPLAFAALNGGINEAFKRVSIPSPLPLTPNPTPQPPVGDKRKRSWLNEPRAIIVAAVITGVFVIAAALIPSLINPQNAISPTITPSSTYTVSPTTQEVAAAESLATDTPSPTVLPSDTINPTITSSFTPSPSVTSTQTITPTTYVPTQNLEILTTPTQSVLEQAGFARITSSNISRIGVGTILPGFCGIFETTQSGDSSFRITYGGDQVIVTEGYWEGYGVYNLISGQHFFFVDTGFDVDASGTMVALNEYQDAQGHRMGSGLYSTLTGEQLMHLPNSTRYEFSPMSNFVAVFDIGSLYDVDMASPILSFEPHREVGFSPNETFLVVQGDAVYSLTGLQPLYNIPDNEFMISPDERFLAIRNSGVYRLQDGEFLFPISDGAFKFSPDSKFLFVRGDGIYNLTTRTRDLSISDVDVKIAPDNSYIVVDGLGVYTVNGTELIERYSLPLGESQISPNGLWIAQLLEQNETYQIEVISASTGEVEYSLNSEDYLPQFSDDGYRLSYINENSENSVILDIVNGTSVQIGFSGFIGLFNPDGSLYVADVYLEDSTHIYGIFDTTTGDLVRSVFEDSASMPSLGGTSLFTATYITVLTHLGGCLVIGDINNSWVNPIGFLVAGTVNINVRSSPSLDSPVRYTVCPRCEAAILGREGDWFQTFSGWVSTSAPELLYLPAGLN